METIRTAPTPRHQKLTAVLAIFAVLAISGAVLAWHVSQRHVVATTASAAMPDHAALTAQLKASESPNKVFTIAIDETKQVSGPTTMRVRLNDAVRVNIKAAGKEEIQAGLTGYAIYTESAPEDDTPGGFSFVADKAGTFPYYAVTEPDADGNYTKVDLGTIVVQ